MLETKCYPCLSVSIRGSPLNRHGSAGSDAPTVTTIANAPPTSSLRFCARTQRVAALYMNTSSSSSDSLLKFLAWLDKNKKRVGLITGAVALAVALLAVIFYYQSQKEERASD